MATLAVRSILAINPLSGWNNWGMRSLVVITWPAIYISLSFERPISLTARTVTEGFSFTGDK